MTTDNRGAERADTAENLAMIAYGLLFASIFFAGAPALIAVVIAYSQRREAPTRIRSHFDFQIKVFWAAFALTLAAASCGLAGVRTDSRTSLRTQSAWRRRRRRRAG